MEERDEILITALRSVYHMLKTKLPNRFHQDYINSVFEKIGQPLEE